MARRSFRPNRPPRRRGPRKEGRGGAAVEAAIDPNAVLELPPSLMVSQLATAMHANPIDIIKQLMRSGIMATVNEVIDFEMAATVATTLGHRVRRLDDSDAEKEADPLKPAEDAEEDLEPRAPVVTILGHVDHGKTTLLDAIRNTNVADKEVGGITQHIGAYQVENDGVKLTFLDTPGHEAFTAMRARGAQATDVAILVVAADDGVMPQTTEAVDHAKAAGVPIVVAINKMDRPDADPDRVKRQLSELGLLPEDWGGDTIMVPVSAKSKEGISDLLENLMVVTEVQELRANPNRPASGVVVEAQLDKSKGPLATVLVQQGTLRVGDNIVVGDTWGRIKAMILDTGRRTKEAGPSTPVEILGLTTLPAAGDPFLATEDERSAKALMETRLRRKESQQAGSLSMEEVSTRIQSGETKELPIILKCDVSGSIEAVRAVIAKSSSEIAQVRILHAAAGTVTESDILLASASSAIVMGFNTRIEPGAKALAEQNRVQIRLYDIIYQLAEDVEKAIQGLLTPEDKEVLDGHVEVRAVFSVGRRDKIAGCQVLDGLVSRNSQVRITRGKELIFTGGISTLKRFKDDAREVTAGFECGLTVEGFTDFEEGDLLEAFHIEQG
ncbi:MAG: translation initiation factor IF-2 [SAR202 cluster bacterium]|nr:translation initiation factor IF-2 [SAR202 cluster bacterium]